MQMDSELKQLIEIMIEKKAADLILTEGQPPLLRVIGDLVPVVSHKKMASDDVKRIAYSILTERQKKKFEQYHEVDSSFGLGTVARFRVNVFRQQSALSE